MPAFAAVLLVWQLPCDIVAVIVTEELIEDVDGRGTKEWLVVAAAFVEGAGGAAVGLAAMTVAELVAGAVDDIYAEGIVSET